MLATALGATAFLPGPQATQPLALAGRARRATNAVSTIAVFGASGRTGSEVVLQALVMPLVLMVQVAEDHHITDTHRLLQVQPKKALVQRVVEFQYLNM